MQGNELRKKYLAFFEERGHTVIPSASIVPENDPSVLFTTAGMQPLVPFLLGQKHPAGKRLVDAQKCLRTGDIDEVGDTTHHTFFEMLGNWSLGDYFKKEAITWSFTFLTKELVIPLDRLAVTVFAGDDDAPRDDEAAAMWRELGLVEDRIAYLGKEDNWWPAGGKNPGPQGPDSEMFYWSDTKEKAPAVFDPSDERWVEIWNDVFMQYNKNESGTYEPLKQQNVDTGMGLERVTAVLNGFDDNYRTDLFWPIIQVIESITGKKYDDSIEIKRAMRIIADHVKAAVMIMGDVSGMEPSNLDQGYILRRLIRRAVRMAKVLGLEKPFTTQVAIPVFEIYGKVYPEIIERKKFVHENLDREEKKFRETLEKGLREFNKMAFDKEIPADKAFTLFSTYGFPLEMTEELAKENNLTVDVDGFQREFLKHQALSRSGAEKKFKGGLADTSEMSVKYHTATHLLHAAVRKVLGPHAVQKGSNINADRLRFDFAYPEKLTLEQKEEIETLVNAAIESDYPVTWQELPLSEAKKKDAIGLFGDNYGDVVKVYTVGDPDGVPEARVGAATFSREFCGGPHVERTGELGHFKIKKEQSSSAGVRRIKAILE